MMDNVFLTILNMSLTGAFIIAVICLVRLPLKRVPKMISYCLWAVAGFRLAFPFTIESMWSLVPFRAPIETSNTTQPVLPTGGNISAAESTITGTTQGTASGLYPTATNVGTAEIAVLATDTSPLQNLVAIATVVWLIGVALMLTYAVVSYLILTHKMRNATLLNSNIYEADAVQSPFVLGLLAPKIYLPLNLTDNARQYIILHEQTHIRRRDHIVKFVAYFVLSLHWFNPLAWVAYILMNTDMEMSCDEAILKTLGRKIKSDYSRTLVTLATDWRIRAPTPLAFSEGGVKERIKHIMKFKKASRLVSIIAIALVVILSVGFAVSRSDQETHDVPELERVDEAPTEEQATEEAPEPNSDSIVDDEPEPDTTDEVRPPHFYTEVVELDTDIISLTFEGAQFTVREYWFPSNGGTSSADTDAIPPEEAGLIGAEFIWTMFGESIDGTHIQLEYDAPEWSARTHWRGNVFCAEHSTWSFTFEIDAVSGEWLGIENLQAFEAQLNRGDNDDISLFDYLFNDDAPRFRKTLTPELSIEIQHYAEELISRHSLGYRVAELVVDEVAWPVSLTRDADGNPIATSHIIYINATDGTGGPPFLALRLCLQTLQLFSIRHYHDICPDWVEPVGGVG